MEISFSKKQFEKNIEIYKQQNLLSGHFIDFVSTFSTIKFCRTQENELNLYEKHYGLSIYYHAQEGAFKEAENIVLEEITDDLDVIYFYGLGLGYIYKALQKWLQANPKHKLVFFEDNLEAIYCFLHTEEAETILKDPQVKIYSDLEASPLFNKAIYPYINLKSKFLVLPLYVEKKQNQAIKLYYAIYYNQSSLEYMMSEFLSGQTGFSSNFYPNLLCLPDGYLGSGLYEKFKDIPAIICGAGPSLEKNIDVLKSLNDKAIIFGGGSSLNVLNGYGMSPHFGLGIDPNQEQTHRLITNHAFYLPFFYRNRMTHKAFQNIQGPKLLVPDSPHPLPRWFENKLGISHASGPIVEEGYNVVNFCTEIACRMGCNPIIYVGLDLSYTEIKSYAPGIPIHPLWLGKSNPYAKDRNEQLIRRKDINGKDISTKWAWISEGMWISHYVKANPKTTFINATEGGLGLESIQNWPLAKVKEHFLIKTYDLFSRIQGEIQNNKIHVDRFQIINAIIEMKKSLEKCQNYCNNIIEEEKSHYHTLSLAAPYTGKAILFEAELQAELAYKHFLITFDESASFFIDNLYEKASFDLKEKIKQIIHHYTFLHAVLSQQIEIINHSVKAFIFLNPLTKAEEKKKTSLTPITEGVYKFEDHVLELKDPTYDLNIDLNFDPLIEEEFYPDGKLKIRTVYNQDKKFQGPSRYYSKNGNLLAETWFVDGQKQGKSLLFYDNGSLYASLGFRNDKLEGKNNYYTIEGKPHMLLNFKEGLLHGLNEIYNTHGILLRQLHYNKGQRHGTEKTWDEEGNLVSECHYINGIPHGTSKEFSKKRLIKEVYIHQYPKDFDSTAYENDKIKEVYKHGLLDFSFVYLEKQKQAETIKLVLDNVMEKMHLFIKNKVGEEVDPETLAQFEKILASNQEVQKMMDHLTELKDEYFAQTKEAQKQLKDENEGHRDQEEK